MDLYKLTLYKYKYADFSISLSTAHSLKEKSLDYVTS